MTARVDLTNNNLLKRLNFDPGEIIPLLYGKDVPLNLQQQELLAKNFLPYKK